MNYILTKEKFNDNHLMMPVLDEILDKIREAAEQRGFNQKKLAECLDVSEPTVSRIMLKKRGLSAEMLVKMAKVLDINPASLLPGGNPKSKLEFEDYMWESIKERLDKYFEEKFKELLKQNKS